MEKHTCINKIKEAGVVGEGGAGFPAHVKYQADVAVILGNGCECEPLLHTDAHIMRHESANIGLAMRALGEAAGARRLVLALKKKHVELIALLRQNLEPFGVELFLADDFYPAGDEQVLLREVTGRSVPPLGLPLHAGAIVANVGTLARAGAAIENGAPVTDKFLTVTGAVRHPGVIQAPIGAPLLSCLEFCGGALPPDPVFVIGGPMMGRVVAGIDALVSETVTKTTGGLVVLPAGHPLHCNASLGVETMRRRAANACIQCRACSDLCPRALIGHPFETHRIMRAFAAGNEVSEAGTAAAMCSECGACEQYVCPMGMSPRRVNQAVKAKLREAKLEYSGPRTPHEENTAWRAWRKIPTARLAARIGIAAYMDIETPFLGKVTPREVFIPLQQHIGAPATPSVSVGQRVNKGDCIGEIPKNEILKDALGARIHAGISGVVTAVNSGIGIAATQRTLQCDAR